MPEELLLDTAKVLVTHHDPRTCEVVFNDRFHAICRYWGVRPRACAPYRAGTKGKDERGVGCVKANAIAGRHFASWAALEAHLTRWMREVADRRIHGTIGEAPIVRFDRDEAAALRPLPGCPPFRQFREVGGVSMATAASILTPTTTACPGASSAAPSPSDSKPARF